MFEDVLLLSQKPQGLMYAATYGFMGGIFMPFTWILCHMFYIISCGFTIYQDNTRPWVWGIVVCLIPFLLTLKSQQMRTYIGYHASMGAYWILLFVLNASMTGPLHKGDYEPVITSFFASNGGQYYNITLTKNTTQPEFFLVAQSPDSLAAIRSTTDFMAISALVLSFTCFFLNLMYFDFEHLSPSVDPGKQP
jgi:hypothetical protein